MLKEVLEEAVARGSKIRADVTKEILNSQLVADLANNERVVNAVAEVLRTTDQISQVLQKKAKNVISIMDIPSRRQMKVYERRVARLERDVNALTRKLANKKSAPRKKTKKRITVKKTGARKTGAGLKVVRKKAALKSS